MLTIAAKDLRVGDIIETFRGAAKVTGVTPVGRRVLVDCRDDYAEEFSDTTRVRIHGREF